MRYLFLSLIFCIGFADFSTGQSIDLSKNAVTIDISSLPSRTIIGRTYRQSSQNLGAESTLVRDKFRKKWVNEFVKKSGGKLITNVIAVDKPTQERTKAPIKFNAYVESIYYILYPDLNKTGVFQFKYNYVLNQLGSPKAPKSEYMETIDIGMTFIGWLNGD